MLLVAAGCGGDDDGGLRRDHGHEPDTPTAAADGLPPVAAPAPQPEGHERRPPAANLAPAGATT